jgi:hypothetical protein
MSVLFHPPPSELIVPVSQQSALQFGPSTPFGRTHVACLWASDPSPATLRPVSRLSLLSLVERHVHDYYGSCVSIGLAPRSRSRHAVLSHVLDRCRCPVRIVTDFVSPGPPLGGCRAASWSTRYEAAVGYKCSTTGRRTHPLDPGIQAVQLSPWRSGLADPPRLQHFCPLSASRPGSASPSPFGSGLGRRPSNIPPGYSTLRVGCDSPLDGANVG